MDIDNSNTPENGQYNVLRQDSVPPPFYQPIFNTYTVSTEENNTSRDQSMQDHADTTAQLGSMAITQNSSLQHEHYNVLRQDSVPPPFYQPIFNTTSAVEKSSNSGQTQSVQDHTDTTDHSGSLNITQNKTLPQDRLVQSVYQPVHNPSSMDTGQPSHTDSNGYILPGYTGTGIPKADNMVSDSSHKRKIDDTGSVSVDGDYLKPVNQPNNDTLDYIDPLYQQYKATSGQNTNPGSVYSKVSEGQVSGSGLNSNHTPGLSSNSTGNTYLELLTNENKDHRVEMDSSNNSVHKYSNTYLELVNNTSNMMTVENLPSEHFTTDVNTSDSINPNTKVPNSHVYQEPHLDTRASDSHVYQEPNVDTAVPYSHGYQQLGFPQFTRSQANSQHKPDSSTSNVYETIPVDNTAKIVDPYGQTDTTSIAKILSSKEENTGFHYLQKFNKKLVILLSAAFLSVIIIATVVTLVLTLYVIPRNKLRNVEISQTTPLPSYSLFTSTGLTSLTPDTSVPFDPFMTDKSRAILDLAPALYIPLDDIQNTASPSVSTSNSYVNLNKNSNIFPSEDPWLDGAVFNTTGYLEYKDEVANQYTNSCLLRPVDCESGWTLSFVIQNYDVLSEPNSQLYIFTSFARKINPGNVVEKYDYVNVHLYKKDVYDSTITMRVRIYLNTLHDVVEVEHNLETDPQSSWLHVVIALNNNVPIQDRQRDLRLYFNGTKVYNSYSSNKEITEGDIYNSDVAHFWLGSHPSEDEQAADKYQYQGELDDIIIFEEYKEQDFISNLYKDIFLKHLQDNNAPL